MKMTFPNPDDILNFTLTIEPDEGMYKGGVFNFSFSVNQNFPHDPPKVKCTQKIYHPNIDLEGNVCLNILREDWKPVLNLNAVIVGMQVRYSSILTVIVHEPTMFSSYSSNRMRPIRLTRRLRKISGLIVKASNATCATPWPAGPSEATRSSGCYGRLNCCRLDTGHWVSPGRAMRQVTSAPGSGDLK
jgi:hypothetical protein